MIELKSVYLTIVTWDLTKRWTENVSKYMIELKSVYLTTVTWDLTKMIKVNWTKICVLNIVTWDLTKSWTENVSKRFCVHNMENMRFNRKMEWKCVQD